MDKAICSGVPFTKWLCKIEERLFEINCAKIDLKSKYSCKLSNAVLLLYLTYQRGYGNIYPSETLKGKIVETNH